MAESSPQYARVEQPFGFPAPLIHCPMCGAPTVDAATGDPNPCHHALFIYVGAVGEFIYESEQFSHRIQEVDDEPSLDDFQAFLKAAGYDNKVLAIEVTHGGMACGPVWETDVYGFDLGQEATPAGDQEG